MADESQSQIDLKKILAASLSQECKRIISGLLDDSIELTVAQALEIIRNHIYDKTVKEYLTTLTLRFRENPSVVVTFPSLRRGVRIPIDIAKSRFYRHELIKHLVQQSTYVWTDVFRTSIEFAAAASINKQREPAGPRRKRTLEEMLE